MIKSKWMTALATVFMTAAIAFVSIGLLIPDVYSAVSGHSAPPYVSAMDKSKILQIEIVADEAAWADMLANAQAEEYINATVVINGQKIGNVGVRPKGNSSLSQVASNPDSDRYSFKFEFDHYVGGQTWLGLDKLVVNNMQGDASYMKEYLSYDILNYTGVDTPLYAFADIRVNGESWGFYLAVEALEESYAARVYGKDYGKLYKPESMGMRGNGQMEEFIRNMNGDGTDADALSQVMQGMGNRFLGVAPDNQQQQGGGRQRPEGQQGGNMQMPADGNMQFPDGFQIPADGNMQFPDGFQMPADGNMQLPDGFQMPTDGNMQLPDGFTMPEGGLAGGFGGMMGGMGGGSTLQYTDDAIDSYSTIFEGSVFKITDADSRRLIESLRKLSLSEDLESVVDVEKTLQYFAAHTFVVNLDSYVTNMSHNYYLYESNGQLTMLPWDYNLAFGGFQSGNASSVVNFPIDTPVSGTTLAERPILGQLLAVQAYMDLYHSYLQDIVDGYFNNGHFAETVAALDTLIATHVKNDPTAFYDGAAYDAAVAELTKLALLRAESVEGQLNGTVPSTTEAQAANPEALIDASGLNMSALGSMGGGMGGGLNRLDRDSTGDDSAIIREMPIFGGAAAVNPDAAVPEGEAPAFGGNGNRGNRGDMSPQAAPGASTTASNGNLAEWLLLGGSVVLLALGMVFVLLFQRRKS